MFDLEKGEIILLDKPYEWTSFDLIRKIKSTWMRRYGKGKFKIGHAGTLDPLATGLVIVCVGKATKQIESLMSDEKEYTGVIRLGATTPSFDLETEIDHHFPVDHITNEMISDAVNAFLGEQFQTAPVHSAKKINGKRAYELARKGEEPEIKPNRIVISEFEIDATAFPDLKFRVVCSKGTYIRSLARDFGLKLNSGAHLAELRRTRSGKFRVEEAIPFEKLLSDIAGEPVELRPSSNRGFHRENR